MTRFNPEFKVISIEKALSRRPDQTIEDIAKSLGVGYSTLQTWIRLAKNNKLEKPGTLISKEKTPKTGIKHNNLKP